MPAQAGRVAGRRGEASSNATSDETSAPRLVTGDAGRDLLTQVLAKENMHAAWKRVKANKGKAGVDGMDIAETKRFLVNAWANIKNQLMEGTYLPSPVRRVLISKPEGGERELGIPTVTDRLIQQAMLQVLQPIIDPTFSEHSHGFRPGRQARDAILAAQQHVQDGFHVVVDVDLTKFFDRVNHDILIDRLRRRVDDAGIIRLVRAYLNAGIMDDGVVIDRSEGTPQGGPLSPLLANVLLDEVDRELERRGHRFVRYADDSNVYVRSVRAGERVMKLLKRLYTMLHLEINESKSAVASAFGRKFLGYELWLQGKSKVMRAVSAKALATFHWKIKQITRRSGGISISEVVGKLRRYVLGWKAYFRLTQTPRIWSRLDEWMRHRMRAIHLKQWKKASTIYRELIKLGAHRHVARAAASHRGRWWHGSSNAMNCAMPISYFDRLGMPRLT
jgi:group II intron reverse transcriptase/maturase